MNRLLVCNLRLLAPKVLLAALVIGLGGAATLLPWEWTGLLVAGGVLGVVLLIRPQLALCLLAFAVPFGSIREWPVGPVNVGLADLLVVVLSVLWLSRMLAARRVIIPRAPLLAPLLLFVLAISPSMLGTSSLELSAKELVKWVEILIIYLFMSSEVEEDSGRWVVWSLLAAGTAEALVGAYQFLARVGPEGFVLFGRFMRAYGHFAQPNPFAGYLGLSAPLAYALTLEAWRIRPWNVRGTLTSTLAGMTPHIASLGSLAVIAAAMVMSWSRGGWVGIVAALLAITVARSRTALVSVIAAVAVVGYVLLVGGGAQYLPAEFVQRFSDFVPYLSGVDVTRVDVTDANWAVIERMAHWLAAIAMFADHLWLGVGIGSYAVAYPQYALGRWRDPLGHAHNYYLNIAAEAGLVGLLAYLFLFGACLVQAWRVIQNTRRAANSDAKQRYWYAVALGALGVLVHFSVHNLFDNLYVHSMNVQLGLVLGLLAIAAKSTHDIDANRD